MFSGIKSHQFIGPKVLDRIIWQGLESNLLPSSSFSVLSDLPKEHSAIRATMPGRALVSFGRKNKFVLKTFRRKKRIWNETHRSRSKLLFKKLLPTQKSLFHGKGWTHSTYFLLTWRGERGRERRGERREGECKLNDKGEGKEGERKGRSGYTS